MRRQPVPDKMERRYNCRVCNIKTGNGIRIKQENKIHRYIDHDPWLHYWFCWVVGFWGFFLLCCCFFFLYTEKKVEEKWGLFGFLPGLLKLRFYLLFYPSTESSNSSILFVNSKKANSWFGLKTFFGS